MSSATPSASPASYARTFGAHPFHTDGDLLALAFAPDGTLWSVEEPGVLRHWDVAARRQLDWHSLEDLETLWCFSDGARLVAGGSDELSLWETASGKVLASWPQPSWVTAMAFHPDGRQLATGHDDGAIRLWQPGRAYPVRELRGHDMAVSALSFRNDGRLASAGEDRAIHLWDLESGAIKGSLLGHHDRIPALAWHPDGRRLVSAGWDTTARLWDTATCEPIILLNSHAGQVQALALSGDGRWLACADSANAVHVWDVDRHRTLTVLRAQAGEVRSLAFAPGTGRGEAPPQLASGGAERVIHLWDARRGAAAEDVADPLLSRTAVAVSPDGRRLESLGAGTHLRTWDMATGRPALELETNPVLRTFAASPDGRWLAGSCAEEDETSRTSLALWAAATGRRQAVLEGQQGPITALAFASDSALLAAGGFQSSDVWLWRIPDGQPALIVPGAAEACSVQALAFAPDNRLLAVAGIDYMATGGGDGLVALWDLTDRRRAVLLRGGAAALAFHPAGRHLAVASLVQSVRVWDTAEGHLVHELIGHLDAVTCVAYSPDGRWLASGGDDRTVRLWDADTGLPCGMAELDTQVKALAFAPDGRSLFTGNGNTSCHQLDVSRMLGDNG